MVVQCQLSEDSIMAFLEETVVATGSARAGVEKKVLTWLGPSGSVSGAERVRVREREGENPGGLAFGPILLLGWKGGARTSAVF